MGKDIDLNFKRFAAGSASIHDDKLDFQISAANVAVGLSNLADYVNVVGLYGGLGFGKSSYVRMILEKFDVNSTLYTYISLTETNEAKDFSKLFSERWLNTLSERYPKIDVTSCLPFMDSILRESGNTIISELLKIISTINLGLTKTKASFFDRYFSKDKSTFTTDEVSKLFGNISEINESLWIIVVDEIERAQFDEIYRLVEIVERFKNEGRSGLPIKLLFLFCISEPDLGQYLNSFSGIDPRARLLKAFFYEDPKSISHKEFLPPVEPAVKQKYVIDKLKVITNRENVHLPATINPNTIGDPSRNFMDHKTAMDYMIAILMESSPRVINRVISSLDLFYGAFRNSTGALKGTAIRFNDIVALEYIKIKYPYLLDFFIETIDVLVNRTENYSFNSAYFIQKRLADSKFGVIDWIEEITDVKIPDSDKTRVKHMVGLVMHYYFDFLGSDYENKQKYKYYGSTSYPETMSDYLSLVAEKTKTVYLDNYYLYQNHIENPKGNLKLIDNNRLLGYARFIFDLKEAPVELNVNLVEEISNRVIELEIKNTVMDMGNTVLSDAVYQFVFQIVAIVEKEKKPDVPSNNFNRAFIALKNVLNNIEIATGLKYIIISTLVNNEGGRGSDIHLRLNETFNRIRQFRGDDILTTIKQVFVEANGRYLSGNRILYEYEENFFYTLYQSWGGNKDNINEIENIREAAKRGLEEFPKAIEIYWRKYPISEEWRNFRDVLDGDHFFTMQYTNSLVYMPLETLIDVTKKSRIDDPQVLSKLYFWESIKDDPKLKELSVVKNDQSTLKSFLTRNGLLD
jgi:hypothetical protein